MHKSEQINELADALAKAQSEIKGAVADSNNPMFKSTYADLASVVEAIRAPFSKNGLCYSQPTELDQEGFIIVETILMHSSGQWLSGKMKIVPGRQKSKDQGGGFEPTKDPQALGSAITYARRYALAAIAGVPQIDDDAETVMNRSGAQVSRSIQLPPRGPVSPVTESFEDFSPAKTNQFITTKQSSLLLAKALGNKWTNKDVAAFFKCKYEIDDLAKLPAKHMQEALGFVSKQFSVAMTEIGEVPF